MTSIALYLLFVGVLATYRSSKYWPLPSNTISWLGKPWWSWGGILSGTVLLLYVNGWTGGILLSLCAYMALSSGIVFFANCGLRIRQIAVVLFHLICILVFF